MKPSYLDRFIRILLSPIGCLAIGSYLGIVFSKLAEPVLMELAPRFPELRLVSPAYVGLQGYVAIAGLSVVLEPRMATRSMFADRTVRLIGIVVPSGVGAILSLPPMLHVLTAPTASIALALDLLVCLGAMRRRYIEWFKTLALAVAGLNLVLAIAGAFYLALSR